MGGYTLMEWANENLTPVVGHSPCCIILVKGWMVWTFRYGDEVTVLNKR